MRWKGTTQSSGDLEFWEPWETLGWSSVLILARVRVSTTRMVGWLDRKSVV